MNIKEQLEQYIERASNDSVEKWFKDNGWVATESKVIPSIAAYKAGANEMKELLLIAVRALKDDCFCEFQDIYAVKPVLLKQCEYCKALAEIQEKIKG